VDLGLVVAVVYYDIALCTVETLYIVEAAVYLQYETDVNIGIVSYELLAVCAAFLEFVRVSLL
jgi:hypothetical protein